MTSWTDVNDFFVLGGKPALSTAHKNRAIAFLQLQEDVSGTTADDFIGWIYGQVKGHVNRQTVLDARDAATPDTGDLM